MPTQKRKSRQRNPAAAAGSRPRCGLCGKRGKLTKTPCCDQWICDDTENYVLFSFARNSCYRNHQRHTLCGFHCAEGHSGKWKDCAPCEGSFETEMYVWYGTNEYNFETLENPPEYEPTSCSQCGQVIVLAEGGYAQQGGAYWCAECSGWDPDQFR